jgi:hypothetical protein
MLIILMPPYDICSATTSPSLDGITSAAAADTPRLHYRAIDRRQISSLLPCFRQPSMPISLSPLLLSTLFSLPQLSHNVATTAMAACAFLSAETMPQPVAPRAECRAAAEFFLLAPLVSDY